MPLDQADDGGQTALSWSTDKSLRLWDLAAGEQKGLVKSLKAQVKQLQADPSP